MRVLLCAALIAVTPLEACRPQGHTAKDPDSAATAATAGMAANPPQAQADASGQAYMDIASPEGFAHHRDWAANSFIPQQRVQAGDYVLKNVYIGSTSDFERFEQQGHKGQPPFRLEFDSAQRTKSVATSADLSRKPALTIAASAYFVSELNDPAHQHVFKFVGSDALLGRIRLQATQAVSAEAKSYPPSPRRHAPSSAPPSETLTGVFQANKIPQTFTAVSAKSLTLQR